MSPPFQLIYSTPGIGSRTPGGGAINLIGVVMLVVVLVLVIVCVV